MKNVSLTYHTSLFTHDDWIKLYVKYMLYVKYTHYIFKNEGERLSGVYYVV